MNLDKDQVIGIVGGMGPEAGIALYDSILKQTDARIDQEHLSIALMSFPGFIVDRTKFLAGETDINPGYHIAEIISKLEEVGAGVIGLACNTSYATPIFKVIKDELHALKSEVKLLHMPEAVCGYIHSNHGEVRRIGVMATNGTWKCRVYENLLKENGYETIVPGYEFQNDKIHRMIYDPKFGIKANPDRVTPEVEMLLEEVLYYFKVNQADAIILGCTELSKVLKIEKVEEMHVIDSTKVLAAALINEVTNKSKFWQSQEEISAGYRSEEVQKIN